MGSLSLNLSTTLHRRDGSEPTITSLSKTQIITPPTQSQDYVLPMQAFEADIDRGLGLNWELDQDTGSEHTKEGLTTHRIHGDIDLCGQAKQTDSETRTVSINSAEDRV